MKSVSGETFLSKKGRDRDNEISIVIGCMWCNFSGFYNESDSIVGMQ